MSDPIRPEFLHAAELTRDELKKKRSPVFSIIILLVVVVGASGGGYYLHKTFRAPAEGGDATSTVSNTRPATAPGMSYASTRPAPGSMSSGPATSARSSLAPAMDPLPETLPARVSTPAAPVASVPSAPAIPAVPATATASSTPAASGPLTAPAGFGATPTAPAVPASVPATSAAETAVMQPSGSLPAGTTPAQALAAADKLLAAGTFDKAKQILVTIPTNNPEIHAATLYRLGLVGRYTQDLKLAQDSWARAYLSYPATVAGRLSAVGLGDILYSRYVEAEQDFTQWEKIREAYATALGTDGARFLDDATDRRVGERLNKITAKLIFDPTMKAKGTEIHTLKSGENLTTVAREYGVDASSLVAINAIDPRRLRAGQELKIVSGKLLLVVDKRRFTADFFLDGRFIKRYPCATGAPATETPAGKYTMVSLVKEPLWTAPDGRQYKYGEPGHLIGPRWMAIKGMGTNGLGVHGTVDPTSMGKKISNGCIRLLNNDVIEFFGFASTQQGRESEVLVVE